jgi:hypothetical protein
MRDQKQTAASDAKLSAIELKLGARGRQQEDCAEYQATTAI